MRRLKKIAEALSTLKKDPVKTIRTAWSSIQAAAREGAGARSAAGQDDSAAWVEDCIETIDRLVEVVVDIIAGKPDVEPTTAQPKTAAEMVATGSNDG